MLSVKNGFGSCSFKGLNKEIFQKAIQHTEVFWEIKTVSKAKSKEFVQALNID